VKMKTLYEVVLWEDGGLEGADVAITLEDAARLCTDPRCYVIAVENWSHRRHLNEEEEQQLARARSELARPPRDAKQAGGCQPS
jgi:hypothetical protein